ncbi:hypothetical protein EGM51_17025 [Verrucomicrobia bacterium S94]|nr:hypothetical protein EGM51_17025 [Verrucomicrobia bacterium S94]
MKWIFLFLSLIISGCVSATVPASKFTVHVTDVETGLPVTNAVVETVFEHFYDPWGNKASKIDRRKKQVNREGIICFSGKEQEPGIGCSVDADGYYGDWGGIEGQYMKKNLVLNRWEPWNPTIEVKMRPKKNPVPMINKRVESSKIPVWEKDLGFDLEKGDWVDPYGIGTQSDFFVNMVRRFEHSGDYDAVATIRFPNEGDGIQRYEVPDEFQSSSFKFPYKAPLDGYQDKLILERHATLRKTECNFNPKTDLYIFRVRTELDADGNVVSACYGRTTGRIEIGWGEVFDFSYFFNTNSQSRSLESDEKPY